MNIENFYKNKKILITGHTGFKGSWMSIMLRALGAKVYGLSKDYISALSLTKNFSAIFEKEYYTNIAFDELNTIFNEVKPEYVFHLAAQSLVLKGQIDPFETLMTNSIGTYRVLEASNITPQVKTIVCATTDKVYKNTSNNNSEMSDLGGRDFYSTSKVNAEQIIETYNKTISRKDLNISVVRSGNVIGGGERAQNRLITDLIYSAVNKKKLSIRYPNALRPWQYVLDSVYGYLLVGKYSTVNNKSEIFNLNSNLLSEYRVIDIINKFIEIWNEKFEINFLNQKNKLDETLELRINSEKACKKLNWKPIITLEELITSIVIWEKNYLQSQTLEFSILEVENYLKKRH